MVEDRFIQQLMAETIAGYSAVDPDVKAIFAILNECKNSGIIEDYALCGSFGVMNYTEAFATKDFDVCIAIKSHGIIDLSPIYSAFRQKGYNTFEEQTIIVGNKKLDVLAGDELHNAALRHALPREFDGIPYKVFSPEYLYCIALSVYRISDQLKLQKLADEASLDEKEIQRIVKEFNLGDKLRDWQSRFGNTTGVR